MTKTIVPEQTIDKPVSLNEVKGYRRTGPATTLNTILEACLDAAIDHTEKITGRALCSQQWDAYIHCFPASPTIKFNFGRMQSIDEIEIRYVDGTTVSWSIEDDDVFDENDVLIAHIDRTSDIGGRLTLAHGRMWPMGTLRSVNGVRFRITIGYGAAADVPASVKGYIQLCVGDLFEHRETIQTGLGQTMLELPIGQYLLANHRNHE